MAARRILSLGECMVEMAPRADGAYARNFAGDSFNTAWYLRRLLPAQDAIDYGSAVGTDGISEAMLAFVAASGIGTSRIRRIAERTVGLYMIDLVDGERSFSYWRGQSAARLLAADREFLEASVAGRDLILFSGITLAILSPDDRHTLLSVLAAARAAGSTIAFDPNMRQRLWPDRATMAATIAEAAGVADIALPSFDEDGPAFGEETPEATIDRYRAAGARTVVVKNGAGRIHAFDRAADASDRDATVLHFDPPPVAQVVDTTAAGDSFNAGFLAARLAGAPMAEALARGSALAARVIGSRGALVVPDGPSIAP